MQNDSYDTQQRIIVDSWEKIWLALADNQLDFLIIKLLCYPFETFLKTVLSPVYLRYLISRPWM